MISRQTGGQSGCEEVVAEALYSVSVAANLAGMHAQTLRQYDRLGLVVPSRAKGGGRRYTAADVDLLRHIQSLTQDQGVNLAGVQAILDLESQVGALEEEARLLRRRHARDHAPTRGVFAADRRGHVRLVAHRPVGPGADQEETGQDETANTWYETEQADAASVAEEVSAAVAPIDSALNPRGAPGAGAALELVGRAPGSMVVGHSLAGWQLLAALRLGAFVEQRQKQGGK